MADEEYTQSTEVSREVSLAFRNSLKLLSSLGVTLAVAFVVRFWIPRFLGPEVFGILHFSEKFALMMAFVIAFGADTYIRKEVSFRPEHASDFFGALILFRLGLVLLVFAVESVVLLALDKGALVWQLVFVFTVAHMFAVSNVSIGALLEAKGEVTKLSIVNAGAKVLWGAGCVGGLLLGFGPVSVAVALVVTAAMQTPLLLSAAKKHLGLRLRVSGSAVKNIVVASLPYCAAHIIFGIYAQIDVAILSAFTNDSEVGWYGAAGNIYFIILLLLPVVTSVVMPMGSRLLQQSKALLNQTIQGAIRLVMMITVPMALLISLNAATVVGILFPEGYAPSVNIVRIFSPIIPLTYFCTISVVQLTQLDEIRWVAKVGVVACVSKIIISPFLILLAKQFLGDGGGGIAVAVSSLITETIVAILVTARLRRHRPKDTQFLGIALRLAVVCGIVTGIHQLLANIGFWVVFIDAAAYVAIAIPLKLLPIQKLISMVRNASKK